MHELAHKGKRTAKAGNYKCPLGVLLAWDSWEKVSNDRVVCHLRRELLHTKRGAGFAASTSFEKHASDEAR